MLELVLICSNLLLLILYFFKHKNNQKTKIELENYKKALSNINIPIFTHDENHKFKNANKAFEIAFKDCKNKIIKELDSFQKTSVTECELLYDNGIRKPSIVYYSNFLEGGVGVIVDISKIQKGKKRLFENYESIKFALDGSQDGYWQWDVKSDFIKISKKAKTLLEYSEDEIEAKTMSELLNIIESYDIAKVNEALATHINGGSDFINIDYRLKTSSKQKWLNMRGKGVFSKNDKITKVYGTLRDVTQIKEEISSLKMHHELHTNFIENLPAIFYIKDKSGKYLYANLYYQKLLGFQSFINKTDDELFTKEIAKEIQESDREAFFESKHEHTETYIDDKNQHKKFLTYKLPLEKEKEKILFCFGVELTNHSH
jgi:PAS domain S-box-containing protein